MPSALAQSSIPARLPRTMRGALVLWGLAVAVALLGTWIGFGALPGVNWPLWTMVAAAALRICARAGRSALPRGSFRTPAPRHASAALLLACLLSGAAAITAAPALQAAILLNVAGLAAVALLLTTGTRLERIGPLALALAPFSAAGRALAESAQRGSGALLALRSELARSALRTLAIALPVTAVLFLLLSAADPTFADWRDAAQATLLSTADLARVAFFAVLLTTLLGSYGLAQATEGACVPPTAQNSESPGEDAGLTDLERLGVLGAVAVLLGLFFALQLSYLFSNVGARAGSGVTLAEATHRGFLEMSVAATLCAALILTLDALARRGPQEPRVRLCGWVLIAESLLLVASAYSRVVFYEEAYGFTIQRLYVQVFCVTASAAFLLLALELSAIDLARLTRRVAYTAILALLGLAYWNHSAWIVRQNVTRYEKTGKLDVAYLARLARIDPDAIPELLRSLPRLSSGDAIGLRSRLAADANAHSETGALAWYEWNLRRVQARAALAALNRPVSPASVPPSPSRSGGVRPAFGH